MNVINWLALAAIPLGFGIERGGLLPNHWKRPISQSLIRIFYPALIFGTFTTRLEAEALFLLWPLPVMGAIILMLGYGIGTLLCPRSALFPTPAKRSFRFIAMLPNYSYLPLLLADLLWGAEGMMYVMFIGIGADLFLWTKGVQLLQPLTQKSFRSWQMFLNPPLMTLLLALLLHHPSFSDILSSLRPMAESARWFGSFTLPLSMLLLGMAMARPKPQDSYAFAQKRLLLWRLIACPLLCLFVVRVFFPEISSAAKGVVLLISGMPGAIMSVVLSEAGDGDPGFAANHVMLGHILWVFSGGMFWILGFFR